MSVRSCAFVNLQLRPVCWYCTEKNSLSVRLGRSFGSTLGACQRALGESSAEDREDRDDAPS